jgi:hypothetical protein
VKTTLATLGLAWLVAGASARASQPVCSPLTKDEARGSTCVVCHSQEEDDELCASVVDWRTSVHAEAGVSCDACHGGNAFEEDADLAHDEEEAGFVGAPDWTSVPESCGGCHEVMSDAHREGLLGQKMARGERVAVCSTCHEAHAVSRVDPRRILKDERCGECAELADLVTDMHQRFVEVARPIGPLRRRIESSALDAELHRLRLDAVKTVHGFDRPRIEAVAEGAEERLEGIAAETRRLASESGFRRRVGLGVVGFLVAMGLGLGRLAADHRRRDASSAGTALAPQAKGRS